VVSLEELAHSLGRAADGVCLPVGYLLTRIILGSEMWRVDEPCRVDSTRLGVEKSSLGAVGVEANNKSTDTERTDTTRLSVALLNLGDVLCDVFDRNGVLDGQTMTLSFQAGLVDKDAGVGVQTSKGEADVVVDETNL
jgi:hypothetical protein